MMWTKRIYGLLICFFSVMILKGQVLPVTAFYWENPYVINPASIRPEERAFFSLAARKQWASFPGSPTTFFATGTGYHESWRSQAGIKILKDKIGYINTLDLSGSYAYALRLSYHSGLNLGISGAWQTQRADREEATFDEPDDPVSGDGRFRGISDCNVSLGTEYHYSRSFIAGFSCQNLLSAFRDEPLIWGNTNYFYARYRTLSLGRKFDSGAYLTRSFSRSYDMEYGVCVKQSEKDIQVDGMISVYINRDTQEEKLQFSLFGRSVGEIGFLIGFKLVSELKILCTYDYNFKTIGRNANGSFEVMVTYPVGRKRDCSYPWVK